MALLHASPTDPMWGVVGSVCSSRFKTRLRVWRSGTTVGCGRSVFAFAHSLVWLFRLPAPATKKGPRARVAEILPLAQAGQVLTAAIHRPAVETLLQVARTQAPAMPAAQAVLQAVVSQAVVAQAAVAQAEVSQAAVAQAAVAQAAVAQAAVARALAGPGAAGRARADRVAAAQAVEGRARADRAALARAVVVRARAAPAVAVGVALVRR